eukprot:TsM_000908000 transcript=TsM_000908000 gene=TsM_000908000
MIRVVGSPSVVINGNRVRGGWTISIWPRTKAVSPRSERHSRLLIAGREEKKKRKGKTSPHWWQRRWTLPALKIRQIVQLITRALPQELFLAAISAGVTTDSDIDHCCKTMAQLAIGQQEQSLASEFFNRDQKAGEDDEEYARNLQHLVEPAFGCSPPHRVAVKFRAGVRPPTIVAKLHAVKTNDLNQLVEAATAKRQELLLTLTSLTSNRWSNPAGPRFTPLRRTPRAGEPYYSLSCLLLNASRPFLRVPVKLEGYPCCLLELGAVKSLVNPQAFLNQRNNFHTCLSSINLLSAECNSGIVGALFLSEPTRHQ